MKKLKSVPKLDILYKIGLVLIILASIMTLLRFLGIVPRDYYTNHDVRNYIFLVGAFLMVISQFLLKLKKKRTNIFVLFLFASSTLFSQDYTKQVNAFAQSFENKNIEVLQPFISSQLQFKPVPVANTPAILTNIVTNLPKPNSITIVENVKGKARVAYDFEGLGKSESFIHFDENGKIVRIRFIENIINQQIEAQRQQKVPLPTPGVLGKKFPSKAIEFKAADGLIIHGNLYEIDKHKPIILLMHQAGYNNFEYSDIAPKLNEIGYNCLAVDLRSGGNFAEKTNISNKHAIEKGLKSEMIDAQQDVKAAIDYLYNKYQQNIITWGSSFSSSLALLEGVDNPKVKAIISFSPGDYFGDAAPSLSTVFSQITKPFLVTSSKTEAESLTELIGNSKLKKNQSQFVPKSNGFHGSRALWEGQEGAEEYWNIITEFLTSISID